PAVQQAKQCCYSVAVSTTAAGVLSELVLADADEAVRDDADEGILDAALAELLEYGLRRTSVSNIARRPDVNRVTVYRRFGSKTGLIQAVILRESRRFLASLEDEIDPADTLEDQLVEGLALGIRRARLQPLMTHLLASEPEVMLPLMTGDCAPVVAL